jgi:hypothetical protein
VNSRHLNQANQSRRLGYLALRHDWARGAVESLLRSPSPQLRSRAAPALSALASGDPCAVEALQRLASDPDPDVREAAGYWLAWVCAGKRGPFASLRAALAADAAVRAGVARGIGDAKQCCCGALDVLVLLGCDNDGRVRACAAEALGTAATDRPARAVKLLEDLLFFCRHTDEYINQGAALALARLLAKQAPGALRLAARLADDGTAARRWCAARALAGMADLSLGRSKRLVAWLARDASPLVRAELAMTAGALSAVEAAAMCEVIGELASDHDGSVRGAAATAMGLAAAARAEWALGRLAQCCASSDHHLRLGAAAGLALAAERGQQVAGLLTALACDRWALVRAAAAASLGRVWGASPSARKALLALALDANAEVRAATASALGAAAARPACEEKVWGAVDALRRDEFILVRRNAIATIGRLSVLDAEHAINMLAAHASEASELPELAPALASALAAYGDNRLQGIASVALAARHQSFLRKMTEAAQDPLTADVMNVLADLTRAEPLEDDSTRLAPLVETQRERRGWALLIDVLRSAEGMLHARTLSELAQACDRLPGVRDLADLMRLVPEFEPESPFAAAMRHLSDASSAASRRDRIAHIEAAAELIRAKGAEVAKAPSLLYRTIARRFVALTSAVLSTALRSLSDQAKLRVGMLPARVAPTDSETTLALHLRNEGEAAALNLRLRAQAQPPYEVALIETDAIAELVPGETAVIPLRLTGFVPSGVREGTGTEGSGDCPIISGSLDYDHPHGSPGHRDFTCKQDLGFTSLHIEGARNPFVPGKPLEPDSPLFVGRSATFRFLREALHGAYQENVVALIGQRRIGKTSILRQAQSRLSDLYWPVFIDVQGLLVNDLGSLLRLLAGRCREAVGVAAAVPEASEFAADPQALPRFLRQVMGRAVGSKRLLIMLDEFDDLEHKVRSGLLPQDIFAYLRHLVQHSPGIAFLLSGTNRLEELGQDYWSFLFNLALYRRIGRLRPDSTGRALTETLAQVGIACDALTAYRTWEITGGHPYLLQLVGHYLVSRCQRTGASALTREAVDSCLGEMLEWGDAHLGYLWELADPVEQAVLAVVQGRGHKGATAAQVSEVLGRYACHVSPEVIAAALDGLVDKDLATAVGSTAPRYRLTMGIFGAWIAANQSLPRAIRRAASEFGGAAA